MRIHDNPSWWRPEYDSAWERAKKAFQRDWEQTKHDLGSKHARELGQDARDTVKQATGSQPLPYMTPRPFDQIESASRFGHGARRHYAGRYDSWSHELERELRADWGDDWDADHDAIRRGWDYEPRDPT